MHPNDADEMENSVDPDQTAPKEQSDLDLPCLLELHGRSVLGDRPIMVSAL